jgi:hypothetical protein
MESPVNKPDVCLKCRRLVCLSSLRRSGRASEVLMFSISSNARTAQTYGNFHVHTFILLFIC